MASVNSETGSADPRPRRSETRGHRSRIATVLAVALSIGMAAGLVSYLAASVTLADPVRAGTAELRDRGAAGFFEFCSLPKFEPRFWPECVGGADDWRERGADRLVAFCTEGEPSRFFHFRDCIAEQQPLVSLQVSGGPRLRDLLVGIAAALLAAAGLLASRYVRAVPLRTQRQS